MSSRIHKANGRPPMNTSAAMFALNSKPPKLRQHLTQPIPAMWMRYDQCSQQTYFQATSMHGLDQAGYPGVISQILLPNCYRCHEVMCQSLMPAKSPPGLSSSMSLP